MKSLYVAILSLAIMSPGPAMAHPGMSGDKARHHRTEMAGEPRVRIRGEADGGLAPMAFARWIAAHPRFSYIVPPSVRLASSPTRLLNRASISFKAADVDGNGRISPTELADFIDPFILRPAPPART